MRKGTKLLNDALRDLNKEYNFEDVCGKRKMKRKSKQERENGDKNKLFKKKKKKEKSLKTF